MAPIFSGRLPARLLTRRFSHQRAITCLATTHNRALSAAIASKHLLSVHRTMCNRHSQLLKAILCLALAIRHQQPQRRVQRRRIFSAPALDRTMCQLRSHSSHQPAPFRTTQRRSSVRIKCSRLGVHRRPISSVSSSQTPCRLLTTLAAHQPVRQLRPADSTSADLNRHHRPTVRSTSRTSKCQRRSFPRIICSTSEPAAVSNGAETFARRPVESTNDSNDQRISSQLKLNYFINTIIWRFLFIFLFQILQ